MSILALKSPSGTVNLIPEDIAGTHNVTIPSAGIVSPASLRTELNASGSAPIYACRAWVNFNGTGTVAIRGSGNVSSITDNGTGNYTINFLTAMADINFSSVASGNDGASPTAQRASSTGYNNATTSTRIFTGSTISSSGVDYAVANVSVFR